jgi:long-chain acyl-CoA synthetase
MLAVFLESIAVGAEIVFGSKMVTRQILKDLKEARITMFLGVPLLFNKVLAGIMKGIKAKGPVVYGIMRTLMAVSGLIKKVTGVNPGKKLFHSVLDKASLSTIRICISGGGPLDPGIFRRYNELGIDFVQGYGLTETSPILTLNPTDHYKVTSVGKIVGQVQMKILEPDAGGIGEIAVKGPMVMQGYYKMPEETAAVFTSDGWFRTGDLGYMDSENYVYLTGRAKNLIVTEGGKNVYPEEIENRFQLFGEVEQVLVYGYPGEGTHSSERIGAKLYPSLDWFKEKSPEASTETLWTEAEARMKAVVEEINRNLLPYQRIERIETLREPLEMTTTKKIKRFQT